MCNLIFKFNSCLLYIGEFSSLLNYMSKFKKILNYYINWNYIYFRDYSTTQSAPVKPVLSALPVQPVQGVLPIQPAYGPLIEHPSFVTNQTQGSKVTHHPPVQPSYANIAIKG